MKNKRFKRHRPEKANTPRPIRDKDSLLIGYGLAFAITLIVTLLIK